MALELRLNTMENSDGERRYSRKTRGWNFAPSPRCSMVNAIRDPLTCELNDSDCVMLLNSVAEKNFVSAANWKWFSCAGPWVHVSDVFFVWIPGIRQSESDYSQFPWWRQQTESWVHMCVGRLICLYRLWLSQMCTMWISQKMGGR